MNLYLARHGIAEDQAPGGDAARPLTAEGHERMKEIAAGLGQLSLQVDCVVSSPLLRAVQTAEILARELGTGERVETLRCLAPGGSLPEFLQWLEDEGHENVLAVGHMPDIGEWAARCLTGQRTIGLLFKKGAVCALSFEGEPAAGSARLEWLMQPAALKRIGG